MTMEAAVVVAKARQDVVSHFMQAKAVDAGTASRFVPDRHVQRRMLERLTRQHILIETGPDTYFLDLQTYHDQKRTLRRRIAVLAATLAVIAGVAGFLA